MTPEAQLIVALAAIGGAAAFLVRAWATRITTKAQTELAAQKHQHELDTLRLEIERDREKRHNETEDRLTHIVEQNAELFKAQLNAANEKILRLEGQVTSQQREIELVRQKNDEYLVVNNSLLEMNDKLAKDNKRLLEQSELVPGLRVQIDELKNQLAKLEPAHEKLQKEYDELLQRFNALEKELHANTTTVKGDAA